MGRARPGRGARGAADAWRSLFRAVVGGYWLYFASQKWGGVGWMHSLIEQSARTSPVPLLHDVMARVVAPHWEAFAVAQAVAETLVGVLLVLGLATRPAALLGALLAGNLSLTVAFLTPDAGFRWLYYLGVLVSLEVAVTGGGPLALERLRSVPAWMRT